MVYPQTVDAAFTRQMEAEHILEALAQAVLEAWAPHAETGYATGTALTASSDPRSWWRILWTHIYNHGAGLLYSDSMQRAATALGVTFPEPPPGAVIDTPPAVPATGVDIGKLHRKAETIVTRGLGYTPDRKPAFTIRRAQTAYLTDATNRYANVPDTIFTAVTHDIDRSLAAGENPDEDMTTRVKRTLAQHVAPAELNKTARMIARTESAAAQTRATLDVAKVTTSTGSSDLQKIWCCTLDSKTRREHWQADGQRVPVDTQFHLGRYRVDHPGDGPPAMARNCRCAVFVLRADEADPRENDRHTERLNGRDATAVNRNGRTQQQEIEARAREGNVRARDTPDGIGTVASATTDISGDTVTIYRTFKATITELGTLTDDGRMLAADMKLSFRTFPLALRWQETADPGHDHAYTVGVIEHAELDGSRVIATGYLLNTPQADLAADQITHGVTRPIVDLVAATAILTDGDGNPLDMAGLMDGTIPEPETVIETVTEGKVLGATLVSIAAFDRPTDIELTGTTEADTATVDSLVASLTATGERVFIDEFRPHYGLFTDPQLAGPTHPTLDETTGRVYGHIALWGKQHTGFAGQARKVEAPRSVSGYSYFHTSRITTAGNEPLMVGKLTVATGHAGLRLASDPAAAHYDNTGTCWAYVRAGEDTHGIWFSGVLHPSADTDMVRDGLASPLSGDWRPIGGGLELVAALSVNTPGFPLVASATDDDGHLLALVASLSPRKLQLRLDPDKVAAALNRTDIFSEGTPTMATAPQDKQAPANDTAPADNAPADGGKFPEGTEVTIKDSGDTGTVEKYLTGQDVYRVNDQWYLENELEGDTTPAEGDQTAPPAVSAAAIARELHTLRKRDEEAAALVAAINASRHAEALTIITRRGH